MKRLLLLLVSALTVTAQSEFRKVTPQSGDGVYLRELTSTAATKTYQYKIDPVTSSESNGYSTLKLGTSPMTNGIGKPIVPFISQQFIVPQGMTLDSISVSNAVPQFSKLAQPLRYGLEPVRPGEPTVSTKRDESIYSSSALYPANTAKLSMVQKSNGISVAFVSLFPVQYRGSTQEIVTTETFDITLHFSQEAPSRSAHTTPAFPERFDTALLGIENPEALGTYSTSRSRSAAEAQLVILTGKEFLNAIVPYTVKDLAARRRSQGFTVKIVTTDSIYNAVNATLDNTPDGEIDRQMKIRYFLSEAYKHWGTEYVLIAGDTNVVPVRILDPNYKARGMTSQYDKDIPSDYYYQCLDGAYNFLHEDSSYVWGLRTREGERDTVTDIWGKTGTMVLDILPELHIGRIPAENPLGFSNWLAKQFTYEGIPHRDEHHRNVLFAGEYAGFVNTSGIWGANKDLMMYSRNPLEEIRQGKTIYTFDFTEDSYDGFTTFPEIDVTTMYDADLVDAGQERWGATEILEKINSDSFSIIQHIGHGLPKTIMHLTSLDLKEMKNSKPLMVISQSCLTGRFTEDCIGENLLTSSDSSGLWAGFFNTGYGYAENDKTDGPVHRINRSFWHGYFKNDNPIVRLGKLHDFGRSGLYYRASLNTNEFNPTRDLYSIFSMHLLGDPTSELKLVREADEKHLYLTSPVGDRTVLLNSTQKITWNTTEDELVTLTLLAEDGTVTEIGKVESSLKELTWTPASFVSAGTGFRMIITGSSMTDTTAAFDLAESVALEIVEYPLDGLSKGETALISWNGDDSLVSVYVMLDGAPVECLAEGTSETSIEWTVPKTAMGSKGYRIRLIGSKSRDSFVDSETFEVFPDIVNTFPYVMDFEGTDNGYILPEFWEQGIFDDFDWRVFAGINSIKKQTLVNPDWDISGPSVDNTTGTDTGKYVYIHSREASVGKQAEMYSPVFDLTGCTGSKLEFALHMYCTSPLTKAEFKIEVLREGTADTVIYLQDTVIAEDKWIPKEVSLEAFDGERIKMRITATSGHSYSSDIAIDDITVSVDEQSVSVLTPNSTVSSNNGKLFVVPSVITPESPIGRIYCKNREPFTFRWSLFDMVGNRLLTGEGSYNGSGTPIDYIDLSRFRGYTGSTILFLETTAQDGSKRVFKTPVGMKK